MFKANLIALVGMCGAGKSEVAKYLESNGYKGVYFGGLTMEEMKKRGLETNPENEKKVRENLRDVHGMGAFAVLSIPKIEALFSSTDKVYIDGLYSWSELKILREKFPNIKVLQVYAPKHLRYSRLAGRPHRPLTEAEAISRDIAEIENLEKGGPIAFCDYLVSNDGDVGHLTGQVEKLVKPN